MVNDEQYSGNDESTNSFNGRRSDSKGTHSEHKNIQDDTKERHAYRISDHDCHSALLPYLFARISSQATPFPIRAEVKLLPLV